MASRRRRRVSIVVRPAFFGHLCTTASEKKTLKKENENKAPNSSKDKFSLAFLATLVTSEFCETAAQNTSNNDNRTHMTLLVVVMAERYLVQLGQNTMQHNPCLSKAFFATPTTKHSHLTPVKKEMLLLQEHCKRE
jgi:hypothetical protein